MRTFTALLLAAAILPARAADPPALSAVRADAIRSHVEFLASDLLEGRAAATRGYDIAAAYVAAQFRQAGLAPAGDNDTFLQAVPLVEATPVLPGSAAKLVRDDETYSFEYGTHYLPSADFVSASSTLTAPLVFAGYGVDAPELGYSDFDNVDLKGRIAVILSGAPAKFPNSQRAYYSWTERKWSSLVERGAVGTIMVPSSVDERRVPWERRVAMSWTPQMRWLDADGKPQRAFPELKLRFFFNHEAAAHLFEHAQANFGEIMATADADEPQGFALPGMLTLSATTGLRRTESVNVLGMLPGADPRLKDEIIVVSAHLDHLGRGPAVNSDSIYNGAHDNAIGIAIILEMARALQASNTRPRRSIVFAAVTAEEKGLLGSDYLAQRARDDGKRIVANLNTDMPLIFVPLRDFLAIGVEHSSLGALARTAAAAEGYRLSPDATPEEVSFIRSDQFSFIRQGIPALVVKGGYEARDPSVDVTAMQRQFRATNYHQPSDDLSLPMDYGTAADLARVDLRILLEAANAPSAPRWQPGDFFAEKFGGSR
ncbi:MAG TPA: M28 family metallopeptidase [Steroidobacteraceae bacterium]|nr:M28 family metallopeptidase [Steroidobacteraceae bacterium]